MGKHGGINRDKFNFLGLRGAGAFKRWNLGTSLADHQRRDLTTYFRYELHKALGSEPKAARQIAGCVSVAQLPVNRRPKRLTTNPSNSRLRKRLNRLPPTSTRKQMKTRLQGPSLLGFLWQPSCFGFSFCGKRVIGMRRSLETCTTEPPILRRPTW